MAPTLILLRKSLLMFWRSKAAVSITFLVPIILIYLFGHVFGLYRTEAGPNGIRIAVVNASPEPAAAQLVAALQAEPAFRVLTHITPPDGTPRPLTEADVRAALQANDYRFAVILPADLLPADGPGVRIRFLVNPRNDIETQTVNGVLQKTIFLQVPQLLGQSLQRGARAFLGETRQNEFNRDLARTITGAFGGDPDVFQQRLAAGEFFPSTAAGTGATASTTTTAPVADHAPDLLSRLVRIETEPVAGQEVKNPMAARLVGGYAIMFLLFAVSGSATSFFEEKRLGVFQRLLASPVRPAHILWARFWFGVILGLVQISALFLAGRVFFGLDVFAQAAGLLAVSLSAAAACSAFGLFVTAFSPNEAAASALATLVVLSMSAVGGAWFPVSFMPDYIQIVSKLTLVYWAVEGFTDVLWAGRPLLEVLPKVGILTLIAAGVMMLSIWRFHRNKFFA